MPLLTLETTPRILMPLTRRAVISSVLCVACLANAMDREGREPYYNIKAGPVYVTLSSGIDTEYTDNVNLSNGTTTPIQPELTINPHFGITAASQLQFAPLSETNTQNLSFTANLGYKDYVFHPELNQQITDINIAPDSELAFVIHAGHFKIRLHDSFSLQSDPTSDGSLSNVAQFRRFVNNAGVDVRWDVNSKTGLNLGYSHSSLNALSITTLGNSATNLTANNFNSSTDTLTFAGDCQVFSLLKVGFNSSAQATTFPSAPEQDSTNYSYGPFMDARLTQFTTITASTGVTQTKQGNVFTGTGAGGQGIADTTTNYFNLSLNNEMNLYYTQTLSVGRQVSLSLLGSQTEVDYIRYRSNWKVNSHVNISSGLFAEDTTDLGLVAGFSHYRRYGADLSTGYQLSKKMSTSLSYRYINKIADDPTQSYKHNTVTWSINYQF